MKKFETIADYLARIESSLSKSKADKVKSTLSEKDPAEKVLYKTFPSAVTKSEADRPATLDIISTKDVDRDGEVLLPQGCDMSSYDKTPTVLFGHEYREIPVGVSKWRKVTDDNILSRTEYYKNQLARDVFEAREALGNSVGFIPKKWVDNPENKESGDVYWGAQPNYDEELYENTLSDNSIEGRPARIFLEWELLEYSKVPVAANPSAVTLALKSAKSEQMRDELEKILEESRTDAKEESSDEESSEEAPEGKEESSEEQKEKEETAADECEECGEAPCACLCDLCGANPCECDKEPEEKDVSDKPEDSTDVESGEETEEDDEVKGLTTEEVIEFIRKGKEDVLQALDSLRQAVESWGEEKPPEGYAGAESAGPESEPESETENDDSKETENGNEQAGEAEEAEEDDLERILAEAEESEEPAEISDEEAEKLLGKVSELIDAKINRLFGKV